MKEWYAIGALFVSLIQISFAPTLLLTLIALLIILVSIGFLIWQRLRYIPKGNVAVINNRHDEFVDYVKGGKTIFLFTDKIAGTFSEDGGNKAEGDARNIRAQKGVPLDIHWKTSYKINVKGLLGIPPDPNNPDEDWPLLDRKERTGMAKKVLDLPLGAIKEATILGIRNAVEKIDVRDLYTGINKIEVETEENGVTQTEEKEVGALAKLEQEITEFVKTAVVDDNAILNDKIKVTLGPIRMPPEVEEAITRDHESWLQTATAIDALEKLQTLVNNFDPNDIARLAALERLHLLAHKAAYKQYKNKFVQHEGYAPNGHQNGKSS